jgi:hypothetical protein
MLNFSSQKNERASTGKEGQAASAPGQGQRGVEIPTSPLSSRFENTLSSSNLPFLTTALSFLSSRAYLDFLLRYPDPRPRMWFSLKRTTCSSPKSQLSTGNPGKPRDLRCAIRVPRTYRPTTSANHHRVLMETPTSPLSFRVSRSGPRNRRSSVPSPGLPVEIGGVGELHAPFLTRKAHTQPCPAHRGRKSGSG